MPVISFVSPKGGVGKTTATLLLAGELAAADWDPAVAFAAYEQRMRAYVEANQQMGQMHVEMLTAVPDPDAGPPPEPDMEALMPIIELGVSGPDLPDYDGVPDTGPSPSTA